MGAIRTCQVCSARFRSKSGSPLRCYECVAANNYGIAPLCGCGCGESVTLNKNWNRWNRFRPAHHDNTPVVIDFRQCVACDGTYRPTSGPQKRCMECIKNNLWPKVQKCACGCGEYTSWSRVNKSWSTYVKNHHLRVLKVGGGKPIPPHLQKWHTFSCKECGVEVRQKRLRLFCSQACYAKSTRQERHSCWTGGVSKAGYRRITQGAEHRVVMEQHVGRKLLKQEVVHHIDQIKTNNKLKNLFLFDCGSCHSFHHGTMRPLAYTYAEIHHTEKMCELIERAIGRSLNRHETVYHRFRDKDHRKIENLWLFHCDDCRARYDKGRVKIRYIYESVHAENKPVPLNDNQQRRRKRRAFRDVSPERWGKATLRRA